ncbi:hypothetical protein [Acinetobacter sp. ANC 3832]|uniref:hypothetical protein n=1 Tax=Acinetobacter sp. ANC 3832 TaxID=1977874 RepID=UPI000A352E74|nr:hypothetical protein [Acinetobacter sp. ANC 3832]OTG93691.1 hypothetical protein B9T35_08190 [Acinetobacter sp. ANC 3832]
MIEKIQVGDKIKAQFENFLGQIIVVEGIVRRIDGSENIVGNDAVSRHPFFVSLDEILEVNNVAMMPNSVLESLKEVS